MPRARDDVHEANRAVARFIAMIDDEVGAIFVTPDYQGHGIGRVLMTTSISMKTARLPTDCEAPIPGSSV